MSDQDTVETDGLVEEVAPHEVPDVKPAAKAEDPKYLKIIGDQGNEIGRLRQELEKMRLSEQRQAEQRRSEPVQQSVGFDLFAGIPENEKYMSTVERGVVNNTIVTLATAFQQELDRRDNALTYMTLKHNKGIDDAVEQEILREVPSLANLPATDRVAVLAELAKSRSGKAPAEKAKEVSNEAARVLARQTSYVEQADRTASDMSGDSQRQAAERRLQNPGRYRTVEDMKKDMRAVGVDVDNPNHMEQAARQLFGGS